MRGGRLLFWGCKMCRIRRNRREALVRERSKLLQRFCSIHCLWHLPFFFLQVERLDVLVRQGKQQRGVSEKVGRDTHWLGLRRWASSHVAFCGF